MDTQASGISSQEMAKVDCGGRGHFMPLPYQEGMKPSSSSENPVGMYSECSGEAEVDNELETQC